jgi:glucan 1,3-beta-glucosidase
VVWLAACVAVADPVALRWSRRHATLRGVNLGGWLVQERWLTGSNATLETSCCGAVASPFHAPGVGAADSEWSLSEALRSANQTGALLAWRDAWVSRVDLERMASLGVNSVRVPFGFWLVAPRAGTPYIRGRGLGYLDDVVQWAEELGLSVVLDLHGACGGQSGSATAGRLAPEWAPADFDLEASVDVVRAVARRYANLSAVVAFELLNEPALPADTALDFYRRASRAVRAAGMDAERVAIVVNLWGDFNAFTQAWPLFNWQLPPSEFPNIVYDLHAYYCFFSWGRSVSPSFLTGAAVDLQSALLDLAGRPAFVGEWSLCLPHAHLEQLRRERRFDSAMRAFSSRQVAAITRGGRLGGFFWTWRGPAHSPVWSFLDAERRGWFDGHPWAGPRFA